MTTCLCLAASYRCIPAKLQGPCALHPGPAPLVSKCSSMNKHTRDDVAMILVVFLGQAIHVLVWQDDARI